MGWVTVEEENNTDQGYWGDVADNFLPSVGNLVTDTASAIYNYDETGAALKDLALGIAAKAGIGDADESSINAMVEYYGNRYGSVEGLQEAFRTDPGGVIADVAGILSGGAGITAKAAGLASNSTRMARLSNIANQVSQKTAMIDPITGGLKGAQLIAKGANKLKIPQNVTESMIKPDIRTPEGVSDTILKANVPLSKGGVKKIKGQIGDINSDVMNIVKDVDLSPPLANEIYMPSNDFVQTYLNPNQATKADKSLKMIQNVSDDFPKTFESLEDLQKFKQNLYKDIDWSTNKPKKMVKNEYLRSVASNAREAVEDVSGQAGHGDSIRTLNAQEGLLIEARTPLEKAVKRVRKRNPIGLTSMLSGIAAGSSIGDPLVGLGVGLLTQGLFNPRVGAMMSQGAYNLGNAGKTVDALMPGTRGLIGATRIPETMDEGEKLMQN